MQYDWTSYQIIRMERLHSIPLDFLEPHDTTLNGNISLISYLSDTSNFGTTKFRLPF